MYTLARFPTPSVLQQTRQYIFYIEYDLPVLVKCWVRVYSKFPIGRCRFCVLIMLCPLGSCQLNNATHLWLWRIMYSKIINCAVQESGSVNISSGSPVHKGPGSHVDISVAIIYSLLLVHFSPALKMGGKTDVRGEIQMIPESAYKSSASKN